MASGDGGATGRQAHGKAYRLFLALAPPVLIAAFCALLYRNSLSVPFFFDDQFEITGNAAVRHLHSWWHYLSSHRGLSRLSFALNYSWGGQNPWGYHVVNMAVHAVNGILVYTLVRITLDLPWAARRYSRQSRVLATLVALVFVAHPLQTGAVAYVTQRMEALASLFYVVTLLLFVHSSTRGGWKRPAAAVAAMCTAYLAMLSKEMAITIPAATLLYDLCFLSRARPRAIGRRWIVHALLALAVVVPVTEAIPKIVPPVPRAAQAKETDTIPSAKHAAAKQATAHPPQTAPPGAAAGTPVRHRPRWLIPTAGLGVAGISPLRYLATECGVVLWYLRLFVIPAPLTFDYGWPLVDQILSARVVVPFLVLLLIAVSALAGLRRYPQASFCLGWFFLLLAPSSSVVPLKDAAFEYRMYLPVAALAWLAVVAGRDFIATYTGHGERTRTALRAGAVAVVLWVCVLGFLTVARNRVFQDPLRRALVDTRNAPNNFRPHYDLGTELMRRGHLDKASRALLRAIQLDPTAGPPRIHLAQIYRAQGHLDKAAAQLRHATRDEESSVAGTAYWLLGAVYTARGEPAKALTALLQASRLLPASAPVRRDLTRARRRLGRRTPHRRRDSSSSG